MTGRRVVWAWRHGQRARATGTGMRGGSLQLMCELRMWHLLSCCASPWMSMTTYDNSPEWQRGGGELLVWVFFAQTRCKCYSLEGNWGRCLGKSIWLQVCAHDWVRSFRSLFNVQLLVLDILRQIFKHVLYSGFLQERGAAVQGPQ